MKAERKGSRLDNRLGETLDLAGIFGVAIADTLQVLVIGSVSTSMLSLLVKKLTWYFVSNVLHTPVSSIIATRKGIIALLAMAAAGV